MFGFIKDKLSKLYTAITSKLSALFKGSVDQTTLDKLERILIEADTGMSKTRLLMDRLKKSWEDGNITQGSDLKQALCTELKSLFPPDKSISECRVFLLVGVNGSGKTTLAAKLAHRLQKEGKSVMLVAADTFRAAAQDQLEVWGTRLNVPVVRGIDGQDPASVVFQGCKEAKENNIDAVIVDTAGRLQTRVNLMKELEKINKVIERHFPNELICTLLTVDAMLGQNSLEQARLFQESTQLDGIVLTKMDGTGKGGIAFAIAHTLKISVQAISFGETVEDLRQFDAQAFVQELVNG